MRAAFLGFVMSMALAVTARAEPTFIPEGNPKSLSEWGQLVVEGGTLSPAPGVVPYDLTTPLFSDYALKLRTIWMPAGLSAAYRENDVLDFPVGTVITKTFYFPDLGAPRVEASSGEGHHLDLEKMRLIETRVLVHREDGWVALPYVWDEQEGDAKLARIGEIIDLTLVREDGREEPFAYMVPNVNQCKGCHVTDKASRALQPIGPKPRNLNRDYAFDGGSQNQLAHLQEAGFLGVFPDDMPRNAVWTDEGENLEARARAYLDVNCSHCHSATGPANTSGLNLLPDAPYGPGLGICKPPIAAGQGTGGHLYSIVPGKPGESILLYRLDTTHPAEMMPELGRAVIHEEGVALIRDWIAAMEGGCK